jgi:hypothetical protein
VHNAGPPPEGRQVLQLEEVWRRGADEDDEIFFGFIRQVLTDGEGNVYVLDQQRSVVEVFSAGGEHLRTLSREGEGPGEVRRPEDMLFLPDGTLGIAEYFGGKIVKLHLDGTPAGTILPPTGATGGGNRISIRRARYRGRNLAVSLSQVTPLDVGIRRRQSLASWSVAGEPLAVYLEMTTTPRPEIDGWIEKDQYFPESERWALGRDGRVYAAPDIGDYAVHVYRPGGDLEMVVEHDLPRRRRTAEEKEEIAASLVVIRAGQRVRIPVEVEDLAPAITEMWAREDGSLWVLPGLGERDQDPGIMQTYDVFDGAGAFRRQVAVACPGDPREDRLVFFAPGRVALIRGANDARQNMFGRGEDDGENEPPVHEVVLYRYGER